MSGGEIGMTDGSFGTGTGSDVPPRERRSRLGQATLPPEPPRVGPRRRAWWVLAVLAVAAVTVLVDLPTHSGSSYQRKTLQGYLSRVEHDVAQCRVGLHDAVVAYVGSITGTPVVATGVPATFAKQAIAVCGFADSGVVDLGTTEPPQQVQSKAVDQIAHQVDAWAYRDSFTLLQDLLRVIAGDGGSSRHELAREVLALHDRRARIERLVTSAEETDGAPRRPMRLTRVTSLLPHGVLPVASGSA